jgi:hypothetical protein
MDSPIFILSTGRTGTRFFKDYFNGTSDRVLCTHEPKPSRRFKFLSNLYLDQRIRKDRIANIYEFSRRNLRRKLHGKTYIESSNFMFGCIPALNERFEQIRILHIVRDPVDYVRSHLSHGFWRGHKKFFAKHVPYWLEKLEVSDPSDPVQLLASRWNLVNRQIMSYAETNPYLMIRFGSLFSKDTATSSAILNQIREFCGLSPLGADENGDWLKSPKNISKRTVTMSRKEIELIREMTHDLMNEISDRQ